MEIPALHSEWEADNRGFRGCVTRRCTVTTERAESSYGLPVVVIDGEAFGPAELPQGELQVPADQLEAVRRAGYAANALSAEEIESYWSEGLPLPDGTRLVRY